MSWPPEIPPDEELTDELVKEIFEASQRRFYESHTERWRQVFLDVAGALGERLVDPTAPFMKIGRFDAEGMLGSGSYGMVLKVRDPELDRLAALKLCVDQDPKAGARLMEEARILAKLSHPNIVTVFETGEHEGDLFFVMERVEGSTLHRYALESSTPPHWTELVDIFCTVGEAIAAAHEVGIVHGDIKPNNILIEAETKKPYVVDFGLGRVLGTPTQEALVGTLPFMAPEVLREQDGDALSDQYSLCMALWQCLEDGRLPYSCRDRELLLLDISYGLPPFMNPDIPERVLDVVRVGLDADPSKRHADMLELVRALRLARGPVLVKPNKGPKLIAGLAMLLTAGALIYLLRPSTQPSADPAELVVQPCEPTPWEPSAEVKSICASIRLQQFDGAHSLWRTIGERERSTSQEWLEFARATVIVAKTFEAEGSMYAQFWRVSAHESVKKATRKHAGELGLEVEQVRRELPPELAAIKEQLQRW